MNLTEEELFNRYGKEFPEGHILFEEGDLSDETYIVITGRVRIIKRMKRGDKTLAIIPQDEFFGEMATLLNEPRSATAIIEEAAKLLVVNQQTFEAIIKSNNKIALKIIKKLAERIKNTTQQMEILLFKDANSKIIYGLIHAAENCTHDENGKLAITSPQALASDTGVKKSKVKEILEILQNSKLITSHHEGYLISDKSKLLKFLEFLLLKEELGEFSTESLKAIISEQRKIIN